MNPKRKSLLNFPLCRPYILRMRIERRELLREAKRRGWSALRYAQEVSEYYKKRGWLKEIERRVQGAVVKRLIPDMWAMFRHYYQVSVRKDEYEPPLREKGKPPHATLEQRKKYKAKEGAARLLKRTSTSGSVEEWIIALKARITQETDPVQRKQFKSQIKNLEALR